MEQPHQNSLLELPTEILVEIFCNVDYLTLKVGLRQACRKFYDIIQFTSNGALAAQLFRNNHLYLDQPNEELLHYNNDDWEDEELDLEEYGEKDRNWYYYDLHPAISLLNIETGVRKYSLHPTMVDLGFPTRSGKFIPLISTFAAKETAMRLIGRYAADEIVPKSAFAVCYAKNKQWAEDLTVEEFMEFVLAEAKDLDAYYCGEMYMISPSEGDKFDFQNLLKFNTGHTSKKKNTFYLYTPVLNEDDASIITYRCLFVRAVKPKD